MTNLESVKVIFSFKYDDRVELALDGGRKITIDPKKADLFFYNTIQTGNVLDVEFGKKDTPKSIFWNNRKVYPI